MKKLIMLFLSFSFLYSCAQEKSEENIVFKGEKGNVITKEDLKNVSGTVNWEIMQNEDIPQKALQLHEEARSLGSQGNYELGAEKLLEAHEIAPNWAYPIYDLAYTCLLQKDFENALKYYKQTNEIEPRGFFTAKTAYWSLKNEAAGVFPEGLYLGFTSLEWIDSDEEKIEVAKTIVDKFPHYTPAWQLLGSKLNDKQERLVAINKGLELDSDEETKGILLINKAIVADLNGDTGTAKAILGKLIFAENSTLSNIELAKFILSSLENKK
jgi:tetratricopeptide (TPR) repeat protein